MSETTALLRVVAIDAKSSKRIVFYLSGDTRPDFEDEVPKSEFKAFQAFEFAPIAEEIIQHDVVTTDALFEQVASKDLTEMIQGLAIFTPKDCFVYFADDEELQAWFKYQNGKLKKLYAIGKNPALDSELEGAATHTEAMDLILAKYS